MEQHGTEAALLPNIANQMRSLLSNLYLAASQVIPPEQREQDPALDAKAAILEQSFFRLLRLVNSMSAAEYLSDSQTLSLRDADLVKLVSEVCESSADLAEQLGIQLKFVCAMDRRVCAIHPAAVEQMLAKNASYPTALVAFNDRLALGAIQAIRQAGLKVPDDISIIGYDNSDQAKYSVPKITTVEIHASLMAQTAARMLFQQIDDYEVLPVKILTPVELVEQDSVCQRES